MLDASVLINYLGLGRFDLLAGLPRDLIVTAEVSHEIVRNRAALERALESGEMQVEDRPLGVDAELFARLTARLGVADASCIVTARALGADLAVDDRAASREATAILGPGRLTGTEKLLVEAVRAEMIDEAGADMVLRELIGLRYSPKVTRIRELLT